LAKQASAWLDIQELQLGDKFPVKINEGLRLSRYGVAILSKDYFAKRWPTDELEALLAREHVNKVVLPVRHGLSHDDLRMHHPILANKVSVSTDEGIDKVVEQIAAAVGIPAVEANQADALVKFIMIRIFSGNQADGQQPWNELQPRVFQRSFELATDPVFDVMVVNNSGGTVVFLRASIRILQRTPEAGGTLGYPEPVKIQSNLRIHCPDDWKRFKVTQDRIWTALPDPIEMKKDDSPFRFTLLLENFCDIDSAFSSEVRFCLETDRATAESESIWLLQ
jgi:TIR domain